VKPPGLSRRSTTGQHHAADRDHIMLRMVSRITAKALWPTGCAPKSVSAFGPSLRSMIGD
jgi:hypothetical protein